MITSLIIYKGGLIISSKTYISECLWKHNELLYVQLNNH